MSPEEVIARLVQVGLFDRAVDTALQFELPLNSVFESLASRYIHPYIVITHLHDLCDKLSQPF